MLNTVVTCATFLIALSNVGVLLAYHDLRDIKCRTERISLQDIPDEEVEWSGDIRLQIMCNPGYDLPLNFVSKTGHDVIACTKENRWVPDFVPDCTKEVFPTATTTFSGLVKTSVCPRNKDARLVSLCEKKLGKMNKLCKFLQVSKTDCETGKLRFETKLSSQTEWARHRKPTLQLKEAMGKIPSLFQLPPNLPKVDFTCPEKSTKLWAQGNSPVRCRGCPIGHHLNVKSQKCTPCDHGYYQDEPMSTACKVCPQLKNVSKSNKDIWDQVKKVTKNRQFHLMSCPVQVKQADGSIKVVGFSQDIENAMRQLLEDREDKSGNKITKSGSSECRGFQQNYLLRLLTATMLILFVF